MRILFAQCLLRFNDVSYLPDQVGSIHDRKSLVNLALIVLNTNLDSRKKLSETTEKMDLSVWRSENQAFLQMEN